MCDADALIRQSHILRQLAGPFQDSEPDIEIVSSTLESMKLKEAERTAAIKQLEEEEASEYI